MSKPVVTIIAVSYYGAEDADALVRSLLEQDFSEWELVIVDNSLDLKEQASLKEIARRDPRFKILFPGANLGYFGAAEYARKAKEFNTDVVVMNTDIVFNNSTVLGELRAAATSINDVGILAPSVVSKRTKRDQNPHLTVMPTVGSATFRRWATATPLLTQLSIYASDAKRRLRQNSKSANVAPVARSIYAAHGSFMYFTQRYFDTGGDFRHPLFLFGEEIYAAEHARRHKLITQYLPNVRMDHVEHGSMGMQRSRYLLKLSAQAINYTLGVVRAASKEK